MLRKLQAILTTRVPVPDWALQVFQLMIVLSGPGLAVVGIYVAYLGVRLALLIYRPPAFIGMRWELAWVPIVPLGGGLALMMIGVHRTIQYSVIRSRLRDHRCMNCGYDMRATPRRCPECGTETGLHHEDSA